ncbi:MAG: DUF4175 domain-containing protein [Bacteroidetes bacterium]|nr:DUF4175 domain-containing protein [Bacteroidota bacterium]
MISSLPSYQELIAQLHDRVEAVHRLELRSEAARRGWQALAGASAFAGVAVLTEWGLHGEVGLRTFIAVVFLGSLLCAGVYALVPWLRSAGILRGDTLLAVADRVGASFPTIRDRLVNALQLGPTRVDAGWVSSDLATEAIRLLYAEVEAIDLTTAVDRQPSRRWRLRGLVAAASIAFLTLLFPGSIGSAWYRLALFATPFTPPPMYVFEVEPGNTEVVKGGTVGVRVIVRNAAGELLHRSLPVTLGRRIGGQTTYDRAGMVRDSSGTYRASLTDLRFSSEYVAMVGEHSSVVYRVEVVDRPVITAFGVRLDPPAYSRLSRRQQPDFTGDIRVLPGTVATITGAASKDLIQGRLVFGDSTVVPLTIRGASFTGSFTVRSEGHYRVEVFDEASLANASPVRYPITLLPDAPPTVRVVDPGRNLDIAGDLPIGLLIEAGDDYGISSMRLAYRLSHSKFEEVRETFTYRPLTLPPGDRTRLQTIDQWDVSALHLVPEDVVEYCVEVFDNDNINGPTSARSPLFTLRLPSLEEVFTDLDRGQETAIEEMKEALEDSKKLRDELQKLSRDLKQNKETDWAKEQQTKEMAKRLDDLQKKVDETAKKMDEMTAQMEQQQVLSPETMEKYMELQSLFQEMDTKALQDALRQMQQSMQNIDREQLRQALEQAQFSEERFRQNLERTINLLKRIQVEQKMDEVVKRADDLAKQQAEEGRKADSLGRSTEELAKRQEEFAEAQREMEAAAQDLQRRMEEFFTEMPAEQMMKLNESLEAQQLGEMMRQAAQDMRQGNMNAARQKQQNAQRSLEQFAQQMNALQRQMLQKQAAQTMNALRRATADLLQVSEDQEALRNQARSAPSNSPQLRQNAQGQQRAMQDLGNVISSLGEEAQRSFAVTPGVAKALGQAMTQMQSAMRDLEGRNGTMASQDQTSAMSSLNSAAQQVQDALQQMMQGSDGSPGGMGLMQQLQMMAGQQQSINLQTQQMGNMEMMQRAAEAARLAREQDAVRKSLEQLEREARASTTGERALGDLQQVAEEMREVIRQLERNNASPETIRRQERILSRLLDASRSMQERDFERRRRATTGRTIVRPGPTAVEPQGRSRLREELDRALEQGFARDYQELIRRYFEALEREQTERP